MGKSVVYLFMTFFCLGAHAQNLHQDFLESYVSSVATSCALAAIDGQDERLSYQLRARDLDWVVADVDGTSVVPKVLIKESVASDPGSSQWGVLELSFLNPQGGDILRVVRKGSLRDYEIFMARHGVVARVQNSRTSKGILRRYLIRDSSGLRQVAKSQFDLFIKEAVVPAFVEWTCKN